MQTGKQGADRHFFKSASSVRMDGQNVASSVPIRTCALFGTSSLGTNPKPRVRTSCELRVFAKTLYFHLSLFEKHETDIRNKLSETCFSNPSKSSVRPFAIMQKAGSLRFYSCTDSFFVSQATVPFSSGPGSTDAGQPIMDPSLVSAASSTEGETYCCCLFPQKPN